MAFSMNGGGLGGRRGRRGTGSTLAEINIVPLVDVVLVLLIIFMLTAHVMEFGMEVDVPKTKTAPKDTAEVLPVVNISRDGNLFLIDKPVNINDVGDAIRQKFGKAKGAYLRADKETPWEVVAQVISSLHESKIDVRVVTQPAENIGTRNK
jgi:biopolymer transport protein ExbD/biopolymer transport protein TolR